MRDFYGRGIEIWAGFGPVWQLLRSGCFFSCFHRQQKFKNIVDGENIFGIELLNNNSHGLSPPGGLVSPSGRFVSLLCDQGLHFASIKLCQASWM